MKRFKKIFCLLFVVMALVSCSKGSSKDEASLEIEGTTETLIDNINKSRNKDEKKVADSKSDSNSVKKETTSKKAEKNDSSKENSSSEEKNSSKSKDDLNENEVEIRLKAFGDIMAHDEQVSYAYNVGSGTYDFSSEFEYTKDFIKDSDISVGNFETTVDPNLENMAYPKFNTPKEFIKAIKDAGFDVVTTANNHSLDTGVEGIGTTIDNLNSYDLDFVGTRKDSDGKRIIYKEVSGITVAFLSYTSFTNNTDNPEEYYDYINYLDEDLIEKDIKKAKKKADFIVVYPHWGDEYVSEANQEQIDLGRKMVKWGADIIIGNHPHVVQPYEFYRNQDGKKSFIAYAAGNFISEQSFDTIGDIRTEHTVAFEFRLIKNKETGECHLGKVSAYPIWVGSTYDDYGKSVKNYLVKDFEDGGKYSGVLDENAMYRLEQTKTEVSETLNNEVN